MNKIEYDQKVCCLMCVNSVSEWRYLVKRTDQKVT